MNKDKIREKLSDIKSYWKTPPKGRYMSFKEITSLSVGGIGVKLIVYCIGQMIISTGNALLANTIGIDPTSLYVIYILSVISGFPLTALRASIIDNTRNKKGKYRPYIMRMGIPTAILGIGFILMPYERMTMFWKCFTVLAYNIGFQFFYNFFQDAYDSLINVLSPDSIERSDVISVKSVVENFSPSIANIIFPLLAKLITGEDTLYSLKAFRYAFPPMLVLGLLISILVYVNTEEKTVRAKSHFVQIGFIDAFRAVFHNKYFWIISLAGWLGFLEGAFTNILQWMYNYRGACSAGAYAIIVAISGNASFWPNLAGPFLIRKWGKKKVLIISNLLNIVFIALMLPIVKNADAPNIIWVLLVCVFVNQFMTSLGYLMSPGINADIRDYQQYVSGERIDGMFAAVGLIGSVITMITGLVLPVIYEKAGLNEDVALSLGYDGSNVYDVLYNADYFVNICTVLVIASIIGAALNVIPYFFYDFTESRQGGVVGVLKIKAFFEDYIPGETEIPDEIKELITSALSVRTQTPPEKKGNAKAYREWQIRLFIADELERFSTSQGRAELELAKKIKSAGLNGITKELAPAKDEIRALPKTNESEKAHKRNMTLVRSNILNSVKTAKRNFPDGITGCDMSVLNALYDTEDRLDREIRLASQSNKTDRAELARLSDEKKKVKAEIKAQTKAFIVYNRVAKPYINACNLIKIADCYSKINEIIL